MRALTRQVTILLMVFGGASAANAAEGQPDRLVRKTDSIAPIGRTQPVDPIVALQEQVRALQRQVAALESVLVVTAAGATLQAPAITIRSTGPTEILSGGNATVRSSTNTYIMAANEIRVDGQAKTLIKGATANVEASGGLVMKGSTIQLNSGPGGRPIATIGSTVANGQVITGSTTVFGG
jgi:hypothetical protein